MALETGKYILLNGLIDLFIPQLNGGGGQYICTVTVR